VPSAGAFTFAADPSLEYSLAGPIWSAKMDASVISVCAARSDAPVSSRLDMNQYEHRIAIGEGVEHVLLWASGASIRMDVVGGTVLGGPVTLEARVPLHRLDYQITTVRRLAAVLRNEQLTAVTDARLARLIDALRALDARHEGASLRVIAEGIFGTDEWPGDGEHIKSRARRLVRLSKDVWRSGPRGVLAFAV